MLGLFIATFPWNNTSFRPILWFGELMITFLLDTVCLINQKEIKFIFLDLAGQEPVKIREE